MSDPDRNEPLSDELEGHGIRRGVTESQDETEGHAVRRGRAGESVTESDDEDTEGHRVQRDRI